jgi:hypothetical protein
MPNAETLNLFIDESNELSFDLTIEGTELAKPVVRTVIEGNQFELMFPTDRREEGWTVTIPPLQEVISTGRRNLRLEVVLNNKIFTPLTLETEFSKSQIVEARMISKKNDANPVVKAAVVRTTPKKPVVTLSESPAAEKTEPKPVQEKPAPVKPRVRPERKRSVHKSIPTLEKILESL